MYYIVEKEEQLPNLPEFDKCFVHIITNNSNYHPAISDVSLIYVKPFEGKGYIFCIKHNESLSLKWQSIRKLLSEKEVYAVDAKYTRYFLSGKIQDITLNRSQGKFDFTECEPPIYTDFNSRWSTVKNVNELIPISKHYEYCENIFNIIKPYLYKNSEFEQKEIDVFFKIEKEGIKLDKGCFIKYHEDHNTPQFSIKQGIIYTSYNLYTTTGRPSNAFNSINYLALSKDNGERSCFIPRNDEFIEFDFKAFHPRLLGTLVGYKFSPEEDVYVQIGKILDVDDAKEATFQNIYGGIRFELRDKPFFREVNQFTESIWHEIQQNGYIEAPSGKVFRLKDIEDPNPQKLLNYYIQNFETYQNVIQFHAIFNEFRALTSRIVLYSYDSVLIDSLREESHKIQQIMSGLVYPTHMKVGNNYNDLN